jgi:dethiobiotin synthetase/adenosylmethionine--8-amino-7-oxononanoate aminotransferase
VFFSDDGSTAVEVALKMAFRKYLTDHGLATAAAAADGVQLEVRASKGWDMETRRFVMCIAALTKAKQT